MQENNDVGGGGETESDQTGNGNDSATDSTDRPDRDISRDHFGKDTDLSDRATGGDAGSILRDGDHAASRESISSDTLSSSFGSDWKGNDREWHLLDSSGDDNDAGWSLGDFEFESKPGKGERAGVWSFGDSNDIPQKEGLIDGFINGMSDLWANYQEMKRVNTHGADEYFHCMGHCEASKHGIGGEAASLVIGYGREIVDAPWNVIGKGMSANDSLRDCAKDLDRNRVGRDAALRGERCVDACRPFRPRGM